VLRTRVLTALAAVVVVLGMLFLTSPAVWALFVLAIALVGCWEWSRMCKLTPGGTLLRPRPSARISGSLTSASSR
jgi:CDP-diglyceride synthetase